MAYYNGRASALFFVISTKTSHRKKICIYSDLRSFFGLFVINKCVIENKGDYIMEILLITLLATTIFILLLGKIEKR
jgi:hypothetical protein